MNDHTKYTTQPTSVGTSVIGIKFNKGIIIATDNRISSYGYKKYTDISRIAKINKNTIIGSGGEYSDFQEISRLMLEKAEEDELYNGVDSFLGPKEFANYLSFISYEKRNKMNPYWNTTVIGGFDTEGNTFLNSVDQFGTKYSNNYLYTGFATYFAGPILDNSRAKDSANLSKENAIALINEVFRVLFYRDANAGNHINYGIFEKDESNEIKFSTTSEKIQTNWEHELFKTSHNQRYHPIA